MSRPAPVDYRRPLAESAAAEASELGVFPSYRWLCAPAGLATRRQLAREGLTPGRQPIRAQIVWRKGRRWAALYAVEAARPKRPASPAQLAALGRAMAARRTCRRCGRDAGYCLPERWARVCLDCQESAGVAA